MLINVLDYLDSSGVPNVQAALDDANDGDRVHLPGIQVTGAPYKSPATGPWMIRRSIEVFGDGAGHVGKSGGTTIVPGGSFDVFCIEPPDPGPSRIEYVHLHDFKITVALATGDNGIHVKTAQVRSVGEVRIERVRVLNLGGNGFVFEGSDEYGGAIERVYLVACGAFGCGGKGLLLKRVDQATAVRYGSNACANGGTLVEGTGAAFYRSSWENNPPPNPQLMFNSARCAIVDAGHFEDAGGSAEVACLMDASGGAAWVGASSFSYPSGPPFGETVGLKTTGTVSDGPICIAPNHHARVKTLIEVVQGTFGAVVMPQFTNQQAMGGIVVPGGIVLPATSAGNPGLLASPTISRLPAGAREFAGLILPAMGSEPTWAVQDGMLYYDSTSNQRLRARIAGAWKTVKVTAISP